MGDTSTDEVNDEIQKALAQIKEARSDRSILELYFRQRVLLDQNVFDAIIELFEETYDSRQWKSLQFGFSYNEKTRDDDLMEKCGEAKEKVIKCLGEKFGCEFNMSASSSRCSGGDVGGSYTYEFANTLVTDVNLSSLHKACREGKVEEIREVLFPTSEETNDPKELLVQSTPNIGWIPLHFACYSGNLDAVELLIQKMTECNLLEEAINKEATEDGSTPLHEAIVKRNAAETYSDTQVGGNVDIVKLLIQHGAAVNQKNLEGVSPLQAAFSTNDEAMVLMLIAHGADINVVDEESRTLLHKAVSTGSAELVKLLLDKGIAVNQETKDGEIALNLVQSYNNGDKIYPLLLKAGANPNHPDRNGKTNFQDMCEYYSFEYAKMFLEFGAGVDLQKTCPEGNTPLHFACQNRMGSCNFDVVELLVEHGADVNAKTLAGLTPLHLAANAHYNNDKVLKYLLAKGADVNAKDKKGMAPLQYASEHISCFKLLVENGGDDVAVGLTVPDIENHRRMFGKTLFQSACEEGDLEKVKLFLSYEPDIHHAYDYSGLDSSKGYCYSEEKDGWTAIHSACSGYNCNVDVVQLLVENGANVTVQDASGKTPLHIAAGIDWDNSKVIKYLIENGADVNAKDKDGKTPLDYAEHEESKAALDA